MKISLIRIRARPQLDVAHFPNIRKKSGNGILGDRALTIEVLYYEDRRVVFGKIGLMLVHKNGKRRYSNE